MTQQPPKLNLKQRVKLFLDEYTDSNDTVDARCRKFACWQLEALKKRMSDLFKEYYIHHGQFPTDESEGAFAMLGYLEDEIDELLK